MRYDKHTIIVNKEGRYIPVLCTILIEKSLNSAVGLEGGDIKITPNKYIFSSLDEATNCAIELNNEIRKVGEKHAG